MNSKSLPRLAKETRALFPSWAAIAGLMGVSFLFDTNSRQVMSYSVYVFGCALLGSVIVGQEFQHRTMGLLLSQPVSRQRLWSEKMFVLGVALLGLLMWLAIIWPMRIGFVSFKIRHSQELLRALVQYGFPPLLGFCTGPVLTLLVRITIAGMALTFLCPVALLILSHWLRPQFFVSQYDPRILPDYLVPIFGLYAFTLFWLGYRRFQRLEDIHAQEQEVSLPAWVTQPFVSLTARWLPARGGVLTQLIRKELRLHLPAFMVAGMGVILWLVMLAFISICPSMDRDFLKLLTGSLCLVIPVIVGIVSTAEERGFGLLDWHLTLPVSARRQWFIKVLVALGVNLLLGVLLPGVLGHLASGSFNDQRLYINRAGIISPFLIANLVVFWTALYASTTAANSLRAFLGTIVLIAAGAWVCFQLSSYLNHFHIVSDPVYRMLNRMAVRFSPIEHPYVYMRYIPYGGTLIIVGYLCSLGLVNYRRPLDSLWVPVRQTVMFLVVSLVVLVGMMLLANSIYTLSLPR